MGIVCSRDIWTLINQRINEPTIQCPPRNVKPLQEKDLHKSVDTIFFQSFADIFFIKCTQQSEALPLLLAKDSGYKRAQKAIRVFISLRNLVFFFLVRFLCLWHHLIKQHGIHFLVIYWEMFCFYLNLKFAFFPNIDLFMWCLFFFCQVESIEVFKLVRTFLCLFMSCDHFFTKHSKLSKMHKYRYCQIFISNNLY